MNLSNRSCSFVEAPNCSVAQIREGRIFVFRYEIYPVTNSEVNYSEGQVRFYYSNKNKNKSKTMDTWHSLNQAITTANLSETVLLLPLNIAFEVFKAFEELDEENERKIRSLFS